MEWVIFRKGNGMPSYCSIYVLLSLLIMVLKWPQFVRYANMDYIFLASMMGVMLQLIFASYNIACQWATHLFSRMNASTMPEWLRLAPSTTVKFFVPKFYLPGHIIKCQAPFSFNFAPGVG
jgi:hypothetical protein